MIDPKETPLNHSDGLHSDAAKVDSELTSYDLAGSVTSVTPTAREGRWGWSKFVE